MQEINETEIYKITELSKEFSKKYGMDEQFWFGHFMNVITFSGEEIEDECPCKECNGRYWHYEFCSKYSKNHNPALKR
jgi:hypothetical protein